MLECVLERVSAKYWNVYQLTYKASNFATKMETDDNEPILGKRGRVDGLNSSKKNMEQIKKKTREQEKGRREARSP